jgi:hypothetical protein
MNYSISFSEMNKLAQAINSKKPDPMVFFDQARLYIGFALQYTE